MGQSVLVGARGREEGRGDVRFVRSEELGGEDDVPREVRILRLHDRTTRQPRAEPEPERGDGGTRTMSASARVLPFERVAMRACFLIA